MPTKPTGPKFTRCNQCKLVFRSMTECKRHAELTQHKYKPAYFCTVCLVAFPHKNGRINHIKQSGHAQQQPTAFATAPTRGEVAACLQQAVSSPASAAAESYSEDSYNEHPHSSKQSEVHAQRQAVTFVKPSVSPNPVRCNQCKLVCRNVADLQDHARVTGHAHKPMYFCTVCSITLNKLKDKRDHVMATGHYPPSRIVDLATGTVTTAPSSSGMAL